jgi:hypothetical protein
MVSMNNTESDPNFINHLSTYISFLAVESKVERKEIGKIINDYIIRKDIEPVKNKVAPFLSK